jgi:hypothetical protein
MPTKVDNFLNKQRPLLAVSGPSKQLVFASLNVRFREKQTFAMDFQFLHA